MQSKPFIRRAAMMLALMVLTTVSAWADNVNYYDPTDAVNPNNTVDATAITDGTYVLSTGWYYVSGTVTCDIRIDVYGDVNIILVDGCSFTASEGIHVPSTSTLNIYAQKAGDGCGALTANSYQPGGCGDGAAIGGNGGYDNYSGAADAGETSGTIGIYGGNITANGNIGGGNGGYGADYIDEWNSNYGYGGNGGNGTVYIYGGVVTVSGNIGGGNGGNGDSCAGNCGGGSVNLTWTNSTDRICASNYFGYVKLDKNFSSASNEVFNTSEYNGSTYCYDNYSTCGLNGVTLIPAGEVYTITNSDSYTPKCFALGIYEAFEGTPITLTAINGYTLSSVTVTKAGGGTVSATDNHDGTWSFTMPAKNVTVTATATKTHYEIVDNGTVTLDVADADKLVQGNVTYYKPGATIRFTLTPLDAVSALDDVYVFIPGVENGIIAWSESNGVYSFTMPSGDVCISPVWVATAYRIYAGTDVNISAAANDKILMNEETYYKIGADIQFTVTPQDETMELQSVSVTNYGSGEDVAYTVSAGTYSFNMPAYEVAITPIWQQVRFNINKENNMTLNVSAGGTETVNGHVYYKQGATVTVTVTPPAGQMVSEFRVNNSTDGVTDNGDNSFTFTMPGVDVTLSATYTIDTRGLTLLTGTSAFTVTDGISGVDDLGTENPYTVYYSKDYDDRGEGCIRLLDGKYSSTDESDYSKWCVGGFDAYNPYFNASNPLYVEFNTAEPVIPKNYVLITGNDNSSFNGRNPSDWRILAKVNDSDTEWDEIASVTSDYTMDDVNFTAYTFDFDNPDDKAYQYFRFEITATQGIYDGSEYSYDVMQLSEMQMWVKNAEKLTMNSAGIMTYASTEALDFSQATSTTDGATLTAYIVSNFDGDNGTLTLSSVNAVPAGTGLLLKGTPSTQFLVPVATNAIAPATNYLHGVTSGETIVPVTDGDYTNFILANGKYGIDWYTLSQDGAIGANKAYLSLPTASLSNNAPGFTWIYDGETTGISSMFNGQCSMVNEGSWYTVNGVKLNGQPTQKGIYVNGGHKVVVK